MNAIPSLAPFDDAAAGPEQSQLQSRLIVGERLGVDPAPAWLSHAYAEFRRQVTDPDYPCYFGSRAELAGHLYYSYCEQPDCAQLPAALMTFIRLRQVSPHFDTNLAIFLPPETAPRTHDYYHDRLWQLLQHLHDSDPLPWPQDFAARPDDAHWEFAFGGEQFFVFCASPSYQLRRSRNLGDCQILMMQPRSSFTVIEKEAKGSAARARVRARIAKWDDIGVHPDLGVFGDPASREWKQYFLSDDMSSAAGQCPFHHGKTATASAQTAAAAATDGSTPGEAPAPPTARD